MNSQLYVVEKTGVPSEKHLLEFKQCIDIGSYTVSWKIFPDLVLYPIQFPIYSGQCFLIFSLFCSKHLLFLLPLSYLCLNIQLFYSELLYNLFSDFCNHLAILWYCIAKGHVNGNFKLKEALYMIPLLLYISWMYLMLQAYHMWLNGSRVLFGTQVRSMGVKIPLRKLRGSEA